VSAARAVADTMFAVTGPKSTDRNVAAPSVPPICRKNVTDDVATPISCGDTAFWAASVIGCMLKPSPTPKTSIAITVCHSGVSALTRLNMTSATTITKEPIIGNFL
jgi:hypothetical protein